MSNKTYDILKFIAQIILPALITAYGTIAEAFEIPYTAQILIVAGAVDAFLGAILKGLSDKYYREQEEGENDE